MSGSSTISTQPTLAGFQQFAAAYARIGGAQISLTDPQWQMAFDIAKGTVLREIAVTAPHMYAMAVYNLATDRLIQYGMDPAIDGGCGPMSAMRKKLGIGGFQPGVLTSTSDNGTSASFEVTETLKNLTLGQMENLQTPWGRRYLSIAQSFSPLWGMS